MTQKQLVNAALRMVEDADAEELGQLTVSEIARRLMVNRSTLSRAFTDYYPDLTLREFLEAARRRTPGEFCREWRKRYKEWDRRDAGMHGFCDKIKPREH